MNYEDKVELTDEEWMSLIDNERDGLPSCCGNISTLRDEIIEMARDGCRVSFRHYSLLRAYRACMDGHDMRGLSPALDKLVEQVMTSANITWEHMEAADHRDMKKI